MHASPHSSQTRLDSGLIHQETHSRDSDAASSAAGHNNPHPSAIRDATTCYSGLLARVPSDDNISAITSIVALCDLAPLPRAPLEHAATARLSLNTAHL
jgi:hypothetical protein